MSNANPELECSFNSLRDRCVTTRAEETSDDGHGNAGSKLKHA
jgi:hypothetical protein